jgi:hypothetical protein
MMIAKLALKLMILAFVAAGFLSGCFLVTNTGTIEFDNTLGTSFDCYVNGTYVGTVLGSDWFDYDYTWSGASSTTVSWEVDYAIGGAYYDSGSILVIDGLMSTVIIN